MFYRNLFERASRMHSYRKIEYILETKAFTGKVQRLLIGDEDVNL